MTAKTPALLPGTERALAVICPQCGARRGRACQSPSGRLYPLRHVHAARRREAAQS